MVRKKIDNRIRVMIEEGVSKGHRTLFAVVGDKARDQVVILHHMLTKSAVKARPTVLWCYKKDLEFSNKGKKKMRKLEKKLKHGKMEFGDKGDENPFELFVASTTIRFCYYKETHKILGNTYGMVVLQDFEALTPNLLARTIETVEGGGLVVILLKSVKSLKQLYTMSMDVHSRYRTESHGDVRCRFNERFILSLASNRRSIVTDDDLNILPLSSHVKKMSTPNPGGDEGDASLERLQEIKEQFQDVQPTGCLLNLAKTLDQAKALLEFVDAITDKKLDRTVSLTAGRGRGKSAALGLAIAAAIGFGYTNIFVTSPSPENLRTLFEFIFKAFDAMGYDEHADYDIVQSTNPEFNNAVVKVNVHEEKNDNRRQTVQYLHPHDAQKLGQAELLVIDEAAAIPLPYVKELLGPYLVFMASTINGYEGTGRSLSMKLLVSLRQQQNPLNKAASSNGSQQLSMRTLREVSLEESIRYKPGDAVENWLNRLLCLDANVVRPLSSGCPAKDDCELHYINRDTLFCHHKASEAFLQRIMSLFVASHYKNSPNDLQMMSDAPAHHLFCLLGPTTSPDDVLPEVLCVVQICLEGEISKRNILQSLYRGKRAAGDLIPWTIAQQFQDDNFPSLSGARIVRIATHPDYQRMGYGSRALELLEKYYEMNMPNLMEEDGEDERTEIEALGEDDVSLLEEQVAPRRNLPPLLLKLSERRPERLDYLGVSFGLTQELLRFWKRSGFVPVYLRQTANDLTGEHSTIMLKVLTHCSSSGWLPLFWSDFRRRFTNLLGFDFRKFSPALGLAILTNRISKDEAEVELPLPGEQLQAFITPYDQKRLELYGSNIADYHLIMDLMPNLARLFFVYKVEGMTKPNLGALQQAILVGIGLQCKTVDTLSKELDLPASQLLGLLNTMLKKLTTNVRATQESLIAKSIKPTASVPHEMAPLANSLRSDLEDAADELKKKQRKEELEKLNALNLDLDQYKIKGDDQQWQDVLKKGKPLKSISVKTGEKRLADQIVENAERIQEEERRKKQKKKKSKK